MDKIEIIRGLTNRKFPNISLKNQDGIFLNLQRKDTFRILFYFYSLTGRPDRVLPNNWENIPEAKGCTLLNCAMRDNYDKIIQLNTIPIGVSTQVEEDLKEMCLRLNVPYDVLSDNNLKLTNEIGLPIFELENKVYLKKVMIIVEKNIIKKVFYPILFPYKHIDEVIQWLKKN